MLVSSRRKCFNSSSWDTGEEAEQQMCHLFASPRLSAPRFTILPSLSSTAKSIPSELLLPIFNVSSLQKEKNVSPTRFHC